jgi:hypothetical protein
MDNIFLIAGIISFIFFIAKLLEMRYVDKESKPLKLLIRDSLIVYMCVVFGDFIVDQVSSNTTDIISTQKVAAVFTDDPTF